LTSLGYKFVARMKGLMHSILLLGVIMADWADQKAEKILDAFMADKSQEDMLHLQESIADALRLAFHQGRAAAKERDQSTGTR